MATLAQQADRWATLLQIARNFESIDYAEWRLQEISNERWTFNADPKDDNYKEQCERYVDAADTEMASRVIEDTDKPEDYDYPTITRTTYEYWRNSVEYNGVDEQLINRAKSVLVNSDRSYAQRLANKRSEWLSDLGQSFESYEPEDCYENYNDDGYYIPGSTGGKPPGDDDGGSDDPELENTDLIELPDDDNSDNGTGAGTVREIVIDTQEKNTGPKQDPNYLDKRPAWIDTNVEYKRRKTANGFAIDSAVIKRYYSVIDAEVYFGNEYVEDVHDINWSVRQNVTPLFGYNSYTYDEVARGNRTIFGSFTINFTSPNYLFSILEAANKANNTSITSMISYTVPKLASSAVPTPDGRTFGSRERGHHANMWPQTFDIDIIFGEKTGVGDPVHILILGCAIQSCQMMLSASAAGAPPAIMEQYSFIAQDIKTVVTGENDQTGDDITEKDADNDYDDPGSYTSSNDTPEGNNTDSDGSSDENTEDTEGTENGASSDTPQSLKDKEIADKRAELKDANEFAHVLLSNGDSEGDISASFTKDTGKNVSDKRTCELLARFSALFPDNNNTLTAAEQKELADGIKAAEEKGEYFLVDTDEDSLLALRYTVEHDGEIKACTSIVDVDGEIVNALSKGEYYLLKR